MRSFKEYLAEAFKTYRNKAGKYIATGSGPGCANFMDYGVEEIRDLHITKPNESGEAADFSYCLDLEVATGTYPGYVTFEESGIKKIRNLHIAGPNIDGIAADFRGCVNLRVATGTYPGFVNFANSGVTEIKDLHIAATDIAANFMWCNIEKISNFTYKGRIIANQKTLKLIKEYEAERVVGKKKGPLDDLF